MVRKPYVGKWNQFGQNHWEARGSLHKNLPPVMELRCTFNGGEYTCDFIELTSGANYMVARSGGRPLMNQSGREPLFNPNDVSLILEDLAEMGRILIVAVPLSDIGEDQV